MNDLLRRADAAGTAGHEHEANPRRLVAGDTVFFPLAAAYAVFALPASVFAMLGLTGAFPALASPIGHAHEMLFGFALAVVAGNQLGPMPLPRLALLAGFWVIARAAFLTAPHSALAAVANIAFAALLAVQLAPRLFGAAKKWRNQALPAVLTAICVSSVAYQLSAYAGYAATGRTIMIAAVLLFALLLLFMGGRLIAPTVAGQFYRQGDRLDARVQPHIEGALIVAMAIAAVASVFAESPLFVMLTAAAVSVAGALSTVRLMRWRLWALRGRPDLLCLAAGYGWLAAGLVLYGIALAAGRYQTAALHLVTVGALGTLTLNVMAMTWTLKARQNPARARLRVGATVLVGVAALARMLAGLGVFDFRDLLLIASTLWCGAFAMLLVLFVRLRAS